MGLCGWIIFGFFAGLIARALMPGTQKMGLILTTVLGIAGAFVGGSISSLIMHSNPMRFHASAFLGAVLGSLVLLFIGQMMRGRGRGR